MNTNMKMSAEGELQAAREAAADCRELLVTMTKTGSAQLADMLAFEFKLQGSHAEMAMNAIMGLGVEHYKRRVTTMLLARLAFDLSRKPGADIIATFDDIVLSLSDPGMDDIAKES